MALDRNFQGEKTEKRNESKKKNRKGKKRKKKDKLYIISNIVEKTKTLKRGHTNFHSNQQFS